jgi:exopolyphosphatase/guanosine-5'-triphosphate,3'-diphosphate pyrophosphatase
MIAARHISRVSLRALKLERAPVLAGGLAIMNAAVDELGIERIDPVGGALRLGVLYDLLGRTIDADVRGVTVERFVDRYAVDRAHAARVAALALTLYRQTLPDSTDSVQLVDWAARLHEIGMSVSHIGFHKHGAYILQNGDMPGFSAGDQSRLALLVFGCRGGLAKMQPALGDATRRAQLIALRLAVIFHHARAAIELPRIRLRVARRISLEVSGRWLAAHPLTAHLLAKEREEWAEQGYRWKSLDR